MARRIFHPFSLAEWGMMRCHPRRHDDISLLVEHPTLELPDELLSLLGISLTRLLVVQIVQRPVGDFCVVAAVAVD